MRLIFKFHGGLIKKIVRQYSRISITIYYQTFTTKMSTDQITTQPPAEVPAKKVSPWLAHIAKYRESNPEVSYKQALVAAKETYTSANPNAKPRAPRTAMAVTRTKIRKLKLKLADLEASLNVVVADPVVANA